MAAACLGVTPSLATHIVGGEIIYTCIGGNDYEIRMRVYRDCYLGLAPFDIPGILYVYDGNNNLYTSLSANPTITNIPVTLGNPCLNPPPNICVEEGEYIFLATLPPNTTGYHFVYQRCCRNNSIVNLSAPGNQGATYWQFMPPATVVTCNSSPLFVNLPPVAICANEPLVFDHSAVDPDGDSLVYELCAPYHGASSANPLPAPADPPPYIPVTYAGSYSATYPIDANPAFTIDPVSGLLTGTPTIIGQYVIGVCVKEYRNGVLLATHYRDFQFNVADCTPTVFASTANVDQCGDLTVMFTNTGAAGQFFWNFGDPFSTGDTSNQTYPVYTYPDTGIYTVMCVADPGQACSDTAYAIINLYDPFISSFTHSQPCYGSPMLFSDQTTLSYGNMTNWYWDFGDSTTGSGQNTSHVYTGPGPYTVTLILTTSGGCKDTVTEQITLTPSPTANFGVIPACFGLPYQFIDSSSVILGTIVAWDWSFGDGSTSNLQHPSHTYLTGGTFTVKLIVTTAAGCQDSMSQSVQVYATIANAGADTSLCLGQTLQLQGSGGTSYQWAPAQWLNNPLISDPVTSTPVTITYTLHVADPLGCQDSDDVAVTVHALPVANAGSDTSVCPGAQAQLNASGGLAFTWTPGATLNDPGIQNPVAQPAVTTVYTVTVTDSNGCQDDDEVTAMVLPAPVADAGRDTGFCPGSFVQLFGSGGFTYRWSPSDGLSDTAVSDPLASPQMTTLYHLIVTDINGCTDDDFVEVAVFPDAIADAGSDRIIYFGMSTLLQGTGNGSFLWGPSGAVLNPTSATTLAAPDDTITYWLEVTTSNGCRKRDSVTVFVIDGGKFELPTAFTPDGNGLNDIFRIEKAEGVTLTRFAIYNRWGQVVFETQDIMQGWDGRARGTDQDMGVYAVSIAGIGSFGERVSYYGNVTLIR